MAADGFKLFTEGDALYQDMLEAIDSAQDHVLLESYIFADDEIGRRFADRLMARARAGVIVRLHIDAAGSLFWHSRDLTDQLSAAGVELRWFHRWDWRNPWRYNRRNHRKLLVIDGCRAYVGGFNIHRENSLRYYGEKRWRDTHICIEGAHARSAMELFGRFWIGRKRPAISLNSEFSDTLLSNYTRGARRYLNGRFAHMISYARQSIYISTPYFVPDIRMQRRLTAAAKRGVDVRLLVPCKHDVPLAQWAARAAYDSLMHAGIRIYEYQPRLLHSKVMLVDAAHATIGTANMDYRSIFLNYELNFFSGDARLCQSLETAFHEDLNCSREIKRELWVRRPITHKLLEYIGWLARRWL